MCGFRYVEQIFSFESLINTIAYINYEYID